MLSDDDSENGQKKLAGLISKKTTFHVPLFWRNTT